MVVEDGHGRRVFMVEFLGGLGFEKEILVQEFFRHSVSSLLVVSYFENVFYSMVRIFALGNRKTIHDGSCIRI